MTKLTLEEIEAKGIAERPTDKSIITKDGNLYILLGDNTYVETGAVAMNIASDNVPD